MDEVEDLKYLGDGRLVSCSGDQTIKIWNINDGSCMQSFAAEAYKLFVMRNGKLVTALERPNRVKIWELSSQEALECRTKGMIECFEEISEDFVAYSEWVHDDYTHNIVFCKINSQMSIESVARIEQAHEDTIHCLQALPDGFIASGSDDGCIKLWNKELALERIFQHKDHWVNELKLLPGDILASGSNDRTIRLWNYKSGVCVRKIKPGGEVQKMQVLPNGCLACLIIQQSGKRVIKFYEMKYFKCGSVVPVEQVREHDIIVDLVYLDNNAFACSFENEIRVFDFNNNSLTDICKKTNLFS